MWQRHRLTGSRYCSGPSTVHPGKRSQNRQRNSEHTRYPPLRLWPHLTGPVAPAGASLAAERLCADVWGGQRCLCLRLCRRDGRPVSWPVPGDHFGSARAGMGIGRLCWLMVWWLLVLSYGQPSRCVCPDHWYQLPRLCSDVVGRTAPREAGPIGASSGPLMLLTHRGAERLMQPVPASGMASHARGQSIPSSPRRRRTQFRVNERLQFGLLGYR